MPVRGFWPVPHLLQPPGAAWEGGLGPHPQLRLVSLPLPLGLPSGPAALALWHPDSTAGLMERVLMTVRGSWLSGSCRSRPRTQVTGPQSPRRDSCTQQSLRAERAPALSNSPVLTGRGIHTEGRPRARPPTCQTSAPGLSWPGTGFTCSCDLGFDH